VFFQISLTPQRSSCVHSHAHCHLFSNGTLLQLRPPPCLATTLTLLRKLLQHHQGHWETAWRLKTGSIALLSATWLHAGKSMPLQSIAGYLTLSRYAVVKLQVVPNIIFVRCAQVHMEGCMTMCSSTRSKALLPPTFVCFVPGRTVINGFDLVRHTHECAIAGPRARTHNASASHKPHDGVQPSQTAGGCEHLQPHHTPAPHLFCQVRCSSCCCLGEQAELPLARKY
jgi:hypothetical protein